jgi:long-subunit fatty acid transport protein
VEIAFQSQNGRAPLKGTLEGDTAPAEVPNVFDWKDGYTWRFGVEYRIGVGQADLPLRVGYIFDSAVTNPAYPSAFGTPPAPTQTFTAGVGYVEEHWQANLAVSRRFGDTYVSQEQLDTPACRFCSFAGDYAITMTGLYADVSVDLPL